MLFFKQPDDICQETLACVLLGMHCNQLYSHPASEIKTYPYNWEFFNFIKKSKTYLERRDSEELFSD